MEGGEEIFVQSMILIVAGLRQELIEILSLGSELMLRSTISADESAQQARWELISTKLHWRGYIKGLLATAIIDEHAAPVHEHNLVIAIVGACATLVVSLPLLCTYVRSSQSVQFHGDLSKSFSLGVLIATPPLSMALNFFTVLSPPSRDVLYMVSTFWESIAIWSFLCLIMSFLGHSRYDQLKTLEQEEPCKMWAVPPCCCIWCFWQQHMIPRAATSSDLWIVHACLYQFMVINLICGLADISHGVPAPLIVLIRVSSFLSALYGLLALLKAASATLVGKRTHAKLWLLKGLIVMCMILHRVGERLEMEKHPPGGGIILTSAWSTVCIIPFAFFFNFAYSIDDLTGANCKALGVPEATQPLLQNVQNGS
jgi:hypothetical protein